MKPSQTIDERAQAFLFRNVAVPRDVSQAELLETRAYLRFVIEYLDATEERLAKLEANAPPPEELDPTKPLYVGDGAPAVKRYEPEPEGSEEL